MLILRRDQRPSFSIDEIKLTGKNASHIAEEYASKINYLFQNFLDAIADSRDDKKL